MAKIPNRDVSNIVQLLRRALNFGVSICSYFFILIKIFLQLQAKNNTTS